MLLVLRVVGFRLFVGLLVVRLACGCFEFCLVYGVWYGLLVRLFVGWYSIVSCGMVLVVLGIWFSCACRVCGL